MFVKRALAESYFDWCLNHWTPRLNTWCRKPSWRVMQGIAHKVQLAKWRSSPDAVMSCWWSCPLHSTLVEGATSCVTDHNLTLQPPLTEASRGNQGTEPEIWLYVPEEQNRSLSDAQNAENQHREIEKGQIFHSKMGLNDGEIKWVFWKWFLKKDTKCSSKLTISIKEDERSSYWNSSVWVAPPAFLLSHPSQFLGQSHLFLFNPRPSSAKSP